jgi:site-specific DNA recombinase
VIGSRDVIDEAEAQVIRDATRQIIAGSSLRSVAAKLNAQGSVSPSGKPWGSTTLREVLARQRNAGRRVHRGEVVGAGVWESVVSGDDLDRLTAILRDPSRKPAHGVAAGLAVHARYLLSGIARCGATLKKGPGAGETCGGVMRVLTSPSGLKSYSCARCFGARRRVDLVDELVTRVVVGRLARPDALAAFADRSTDTVELVAHRDALAARLDTASDEYAAGTIDARQLARITARIRPQIDTLAEQIRAASAAPDLVDLARPDIGRVWDGLPLERRRAVINVLMSVTILPTGTGKRWDRPRCGSHGEHRDNRGLHRPGAASAATPCVHRKHRAPAPNRVAEPEPAQRRGALFCKTCRRDVQLTRESWDRLTAGLAAAGKNEFDVSYLPC